MPLASEKARQTASLARVSPISDGERHRLESILDQWQLELSGPEFEVVTAALAKQFPTGRAPKLAQLADVQRQLAEAIKSPARGAVAAALARQYSSKSAPKAPATGSPPASTMGPVAADALRPKILRSAGRLLESPVDESIARLRAAELGMEALAQVDVRAAVSVATDALADAPAVVAVDEAAANLDAGPLADVARNRDWPLLVLLLAVIYYGVSATLVAVENPEVGPEMGQVTESLALALLVVTAYVGGQS